MMESSKVFIATSRQEAFLNCMDVKHLCGSQEEAGTRLILHSLDSVRKGPIQSCTFSHIKLFHHRCACRKQEARNIPGTGSTGTWYHKNCIIARFSVRPCRKNMLPIFSKVYCTKFIVLFRNILELTPK